MNKQLIVGKIIAHLEEELELYRRAAKAAFDEATSEQSKAENKYDTRGLEASYLARGQARQVAETEESLIQLRSLAATPSSPPTTIGNGTLVEMEQGKERVWYFIAPCAGGTEIRHANKDILVLTPHSPLGRALVGKKAGEAVTLVLAGKPQKQKVVSLC